MSQRILAIDDEPHMLVLLERIVREKTPYEITTTSNALEVPALLAEHRYDLIITDLRMPKLDGLDILRQVHEEDRSELVVLITAYGSEESSREARELGVFDYIRKPFKRDEIIDCIERAMSFQRLGRLRRRFDKLLELEPYAEAEEAFRAFYVQRLNRRADGDPAEVARRSGLTPEQVRGALAKSEELQRLSAEGE